MDFLTYLDHQQAEDRRAFIVHAPACAGKSAFARKVQVARQDAYLLDLQKTFLQSDDLPPIQTFGDKMLRSLLLNLTVTASIILVDNMDFLWNTWRSDDRKNFLNWIGVQLRSPAVTTKTFVFFLQSDPQLQTMPLPDSKRHSRVHALSEFSAL